MRARTAAGGRFGCGAARRSGATAGKNRHADAAATEIDALTKYPKSLLQP